MKIATWNLERLAHHKDSFLIYEEIQHCDADILVLTETDSRITPNYPYYYLTPTPLNDASIHYSNTENRVSIFSRYKGISVYPTFDKYTSLCVELETEKGSLVVYGTIIGVYGNRHSNFKDDIVKQMQDIRNIASIGKNVCVIGDYNLSFCDGYYYTKFGRDLVKKTFLECGISLLTDNRKECIDHIALSHRYFSGLDVSIDEWNLDKRLSDHKGISVNI